MVSEITTCVMLSAYQGQTTRKQCGLVLNVKMPKNANRSLRYHLITITAQYGIFR